MKHTKRKGLSKTAKKRALQQLNHKLHDELKFKVKIKEENIQDIQENQASEKTLMDDFETQINSNEPVRELFTPKNIKFKTAVTPEQRASVSVLYMAYRRCLEYNINFSNLKHVLDEFIDFGVSEDRKGRTEFVDAHRLTLQQSQNPNNPNGMPNQMQGMKM